MGLTDKQPLLMEVGPDVKDRFLACEEQTLPANDGEALVFCAITDAIAVGFPSAPEWDRDRVTVHFDELLPDETVGPTSEEIDQLTRSVHAAPICDRHRARVRLGAGSDPVALWKNRGAVFPNLIFGPGVQDNLRKYAHLLSTIVGKLAALDASAMDWRDRASPAPIWKTKVTSESQRLMAKPGSSRITEISIPPRNTGGVRVACAFWRSRPDPFSYRHGLPRCRSRLHRLAPAALRLQPSA